MSRIYHLSARLCEGFHTSGECGISPLDYVASVSVLSASPSFVTSFGVSYGSQRGCLQEHDVDGRVDITPLKQTGQECTIS